MKTYIQQLEEYLSEKGIKNLNITTAHSMGEGEKPTKEQLAKETLEFLKSSENEPARKLTDMVL